LYKTTHGSLPEDQVEAINDAASLLWAEYYEQLDEKRDHDVSS
jgi:hypothetical protein